MFAFFQEELDPEIHTALKSTEEKGCCWGLVASWAIFYLWAIKTMDVSENTRVSIALDDRKFVLSWCRGKHSNWGWNKLSPLSVSAVLSSVVFCPVLIKRHITSLWGHPGHRRGHLLLSAVRQNDLGVLIDQGCTYWKQHQSHRVAFFWEHCTLLGTLLLCIFPQGAVWVGHTVLYVSQYFSDELHTLSFKGLFTCSKTAQRTQFSPF